MSLSGSAPLRAEVITVGNELLNGDLADTNTARFGAVLRQHGVVVHRACTVPDEAEAIVEVLRASAARADLVLISGGLGPTDDDLTMMAAAQAVGRPLVEDAETLRRLIARYERRGFQVNAANKRQALIPEGAVALDNRAGTAPGVRLELGQATCFFFPGVPREVERLMADHLMPWLAERVPVARYHSRTFRTFGCTESQVATKLEGLVVPAGMHVAYRARFPQIQVTLHHQHDGSDAAQGVLGETAAEVRRRLDGILFSEQADVVDLAPVVVSALLEAGQTVALAESCTGGTIGAMLTSVPGVSAAFPGGLVTYANDAKVALAGVDAELIRQHGAVSEPVARAMASGARERLAATWGLAVTGIAGPGGGTPDKPVGTVHWALAGPDGVQHRHRVLPFDRERNRQIAAWFALDLLRHALRKNGSFARTA